MLSALPVSINQDVESLIIFKRSASKITPLFPRSGNLVYIIFKEFSLLIAAGSTLYRDLKLCPPPLNSYDFSHIIF